MKLLNYQILIKTFKNRQRILATRLSINGTGLVRYVLAICLITCLFTPTIFAGQQEIVDSGDAGTPHQPSNHANVHSTTDVSYNSANDALSSRLNDSQVSKVSKMMTSDLGIPLSSLTGSATGTNRQMVQWSDPRPEPDGPTTNWENVYFTTPEGMEVKIMTQITGADGTYGSNDNGGGTGTMWIVVTDADGNTSYLSLCITKGEIVFQDFVSKDMIRDNATVQIEGPGTINEDTSGSWKVVVPDCNLPEEDEDIFEVEWAGPPCASWQAIGGNPASGSGESFSTTFNQPGGQMLMVEATREYKFKTYRAKPNPSYVEGTSPIEDAFIQVLTPMTGSVRGNASKSVTVADITPPDIQFALTGSHDTNNIDVKESPLDKTPPKTISVDLSGNNFTIAIGTPFTFNTIAPAGEAVFIGPTLEPSLMGIVIYEHERFKMAATVKDNYTPTESIDYKWSIIKPTTSEVIIPEGLVEYAVIRADNIDSVDTLMIHVSATDRASNTTMLEIPLTVLSRSSDVRTLATSSKKTN